MTVSAHIAVRWPKRAKNMRASHDCVVGQDFTINPSVLQDFSATLLTPIEHDLVLVVGAVAYSDRRIRRHRSRGWGRELRLTVPVNLPDFWKQPSVKQRLIDCLEYVTGDRWDIEFVTGSLPMAIPQASFDYNPGDYVVVPFSDGLDSYLQWQLLKLEHPSLNILRVHTDSRATNWSRNRRIDIAGGLSDHRLALPISLSVADHPEPTYRSRTFLFYSMAALAAFKVGAQRVIIGENGCGALGPSMVPFGDECPHRTTHPEFTRRLAEFINTLLGAKIRFEHPQLLRTKGQVLRRAAELGVTGWDETHSCTRGKRDKLMGFPCGVCGGCLLRRAAMQEAGLTDKTYFWDNLSGVDLDSCRSDPAGRQSTANDRDIAIHGIFDMSSLARLGSLDETSPVFERAAWQLSDYTHDGRAVDARDIAELAKQHAHEWSSFRAHYSADGFLNQQEEE